MAYVLDVRGNEVGQCSGTVVAPNLILTAGHCAEDMQTGVVERSLGFPGRDRQRGLGSSRNGKAGVRRHQGDPLSLL